MKSKNKPSNKAVLQQVLPEITGKGKTILTHKDAAMDAHDANAGKLLRDESADLGNTVLG